jgi:quercetin dioxygenase-like cupin family protein
MIDIIAPKFSVNQGATSINVYHGNKGQGIPKHTHAYSHLTFCHTGKISVRKENKELVMDRDTQPVNLVGDEWHEIEALEDGTIFVNVLAKE